MVNKIRSSIMTPLQRANLQNERGVALLLTIMLMVVFSLLSVSLFEMLKASTQISGNHRLELRTLYIADAGLEDTIRRLCDTYEDDWDDFVHGLIDPPETPFAYGKYDPDIELKSSVPDPSPSIYARYRIVSTGIVGNFRRTIESYVNLVRVGGPESGNFVAVTTSWQVIPPPSP